MSTHPLPSPHPQSCRSPLPASPRLQVWPAPSGHLWDWARKKSNPWIRGTRSRRPLQLKRFSGNGPHPAAPVGLSLTRCLGHSRGIVSIGSVAAFYEINRFPPTAAWRRRRADRSRCIQGVYGQLGDTLGGWVRCKQGFDASDCLRRECFLAALATDQRGHALNGKELSADGRREGHLGRFLWSTTHGALAIHGESSGFASPTTLGGRARRPSQSASWIRQLEHGGVARSG